jgi:hypothetical protein
MSEKCHLQIPEFGVTTELQLGKCQESTKPDVPSRLVSLETEKSSSEQTRLARDRNPTAASRPTYPHCTKLSSSSVQK